MSEPRDDYPKAYTTDGRTVVACYCAARPLHEWLPNGEDAAFAACPSFPIPKSSTGTALGGAPPRT